MCIVWVGIFILGVIILWIKYAVLSRRETNRFLKGLDEMQEKHNKDMKEHISKVVKVTAPVIRNYFRERDSKKFQCIDKHITLFNKAFKGKNIQHSDWKNDFANKKIVELFRTDVGYSDKTASMDVFYHAYLSWKKYIEHEYNNREWK